MTAFTTRFLPNPDARWSSHRRVLCWLLIMLACLLPVAQAADGITVNAASIQTSEDRYTVNASFNLVLNPTLEEVLKKGVPIYFVVEFEIVKPRWYWAYLQMAHWFDSGVHREYRLSYNALTNSYRVAIGSLHQNFTSLNQALAAIGVIRNWPVLDINALSKGRQYEARVRMRFDTSQLPKPFQINAIGSSEWDVSSDWRSVSFVGAGD